MTWVITNSGVRMHMSSDGWIAFDSNIFVNAVNVKSRVYENCRALIQKVQNNKLKSVITLQNMTEFFGVVTNKKAIETHISSGKALIEVTNFLEASNFKLIFPNKKTFSIFAKIVRDGKPMAQLVHDYFLAATLLSNGINILITENTKDFEEIKGFKAIGLEEYGVR